MKVALIYPRLEHQTKSFLPPLGVVLVATIAREAGFQVKMFDASFDANISALKRDLAAFLNLVPYKGSEIYGNINRYGKLTGKWSTNMISFVPHSMTLEQLKQLNTLAARSFYRRPSYLLRRLLAIRSLEDLKRNLRGFLAYTTLTEADC